MISTELEPSICDYILSSNHILRFLDANYEAICVAIGGVYSQRGDHIRNMYVLNIYGNQLS